MVDVNNKAMICAEVVEPDMLVAYQVMTLVVTGNLMLLHLGSLASYMLPSIEKTENYKSYLILTCM